MDLLPWFLLYIRWFVVPVCCVLAGFATMLFIIAGTNPAAKNFWTPTRIIGIVFGAGGTGFFFVAAKMVATLWGQAFIWTPVYTVCALCIMAALALSFLANFLMARRARDHGAAEN